MRWGEIIKVRSTTAKEQTTEQELTVMAGEFQKNPNNQGLREATVSSHATVPGFFAMRFFVIPIIRSLEGAR
jgi:hypothetical protein